MVHKATRATHGVLLEWCDVTQHAIARRQTLLHLLVGHISRRMHAVFDAWRTRCAVWQGVHK